MMFLNCKIDLSKWNFLPRPETEFWVKKSIKKLKRTDIGCLHVLDIFAGTGCIGIAVLKNIKNSRMDFVDIDKKAIEQIKINLKLNKISSDRCKIYRSDIFKKLKNKKYNYIFANPPYVAMERKNEVQPSVLKYEPHGALFSGKRGLDIIKKFLTRAKDYLADGGVIYMEFDPQQVGSIKDIMKKEGHKKYKFYKDQFKRYRFVKIY